MDIVCGTLQAKLQTKDLSSGSSPCVLLGSRLLTPCDFQRLAGKASARNWKVTIRCLDQPLSRFLESYTDADGKRCCRFVDPTLKCVSTKLQWTQANSQLVGSSGTPPGDLTQSAVHSQPVVLDSSSDDQVPPQFSDLDAVLSTDQAPSQLLDSVRLSSSDH